MKALIAYNLFFAAWNIFGAFFGRDKFTRVIQGICAAVCVANAIYCLSLGV